MRCLVTGAAGFIGSHLCEALVEKGHQVVGLDDLSAGSLATLNEVSGVSLIQGDLRSDDDVAKAAQGCDIVFHHGAVRSVPRSMEAPTLTSQVNIMGTQNVLMAAHREGARVVSASSSSVYGDQESDLLDERLEPRPRSPYAASKLAGEIYCQAWWRTFGIPTISFRYFNVYGPRQDPVSEYAAVVPRFAMACLTGSPPVIHGDGEQSRDFTFVGDVVEANLLAASAPPSACGRVYNIGGGREPTTINWLLAHIAELTGAHPEPVWSPPREGDIRRTRADISLAEAELGYRPQTAIKDGLKTTVEWFQRRFGQGAS